MATSIDEAVAAEADAGQPAEAGAGASERELLYYAAKVCEQSQRYPDMASAMRKIVQGALDNEPSARERSLLAIAYKNLAHQHRASLRLLQRMEHLEQDEQDASSQQRLAVLRGYTSKVEGELQGVCDEVSEMVDVFLLPFATTPEAAVYYLGMKADFCRYSAEFKSGEEREAAATAAFEAYTTAWDTAQSELSPVHPARLGLASTFAVFHAEVLGQPAQAYALAKGALDEAVADEDPFGEKLRNNDTIAMMQLLRNNLKVWKRLVPQAAGGAEGGSSEG
eukprot:CAMPEP_0202879936 /NCGR_PEP_ID=MMETSP1391-20130828/34328_1 /ASSEMBLY_ACC=CAM_ASM_000867 /TAXON_ID=1034604 /ORGANISM="Chlamydomonas leiostraca, Strain SAG 11-49" /LENGTH=279 /DNA_ID=CAMNT_0049562357 /DNA_START=262 /DNA_END=1099 /DNA_ORIENTATION=+